MLTALSSRTTGELRGAPGGSKRRRFPTGPTAVLLATVALLLAAAAPAANDDAEADATIRRCIGLLAQGDLDRARGCFAPDAQLGTNEDLLDRAREALQLGEPLELEVTDPKFQIITEDGRIVRYVYHVRGTDAAALWTVSLRQTATGPALVSLVWYEAPFDLLDSNPFTLVGMSWFTYLVLALAIITPIFMLHTAVVCYRRQPSFLWLWIAFILIGVGRLSVVWRPNVENLENVFFKPVSGLILGIGLIKWPVYDPWVLSVGFPLGAVVFRWWTRNWDKPSNPVTEASQESGTPSGP